MNLWKCVCGDTLLDFKLDGISQNLILCCGGCKETLMICECCQAIQRLNQYDKDNQLKLEEYLSHGDLSNVPHNHPSTSTSPKNSYLHEVDSLKAIQSRNICEVFRLCRSCLFPNIVESRIRSLVGLSPSSVYTTSLSQLVKLNSFCSNYHERISGELCQMSNSFLKNPNFDHKCLRYPLPDYTSLKKRKRRRAGSKNIQLDSISLHRFELLKRLIDISSNYLSCTDDFSPITFNQTHEKDLIYFLNRQSMTDNQKNILVFAKQLVQDSSPVKTIQRKTNIQLNNECPVDYPLSSNFFKYQFGYLSSAPNSIAETNLESLECIRLQFCRTVQELTSGRNDATPSRIYKMLTSSKQINNMKLSTNTVSDFSLQSELKLLKLLYVSAVQEYSNRL
ncbi:hypothetical protein BC833DRAFT_577028 [Globomyces pollinis-pini]|nr:hypothetical protein BC833DRAFT_577028 [Globomyces pollinis-pini]